jgi:hypothetical protein
VVYFMVVVWFGTNIMGAVIIDAYVVAANRQDEEKQRAGKEAAARAMTAKTAGRRKSSTGADGKGGGGGVPQTPDRFSQYAAGAGASPGNNVEREFRKKLEKKNSFVGSREGKMVANKDLEDEKVLAMLQSQLDNTHAEVARSGKVMQRNLARRDSARNIPVLRGASSGGAGGGGGGGGGQRQLWGAGRT